jgi:hypothetical protein
LRDEEYPGPGSYDKLPTAFRSSQVDKIKTEKLYQQQKEKLLKKKITTFNYSDNNYISGEIFPPSPKQKYSFGLKPEQKFNGARKSLHLNGGPKHLRDR